MVAAGNDEYRKPYMDIIEADNLRKSFGSFEAVHDVSIAVKEGEIFGFLGPNGAGKTTTIRMLTGAHPDAVLPVSAGSISAGTRSRPRLKMGIIPENGTVYSDLTAEQNILWTAKFYGLDSATRKRRAEEILACMGLSEKEERHRPHVLQRDAAADQHRLRHRPLATGPLPGRANGRAGCVQPPAGARYDPQDERRGQHDLFDHAQHRGGKRVCTVISVINKGRIVATGSPERLKKTFDTAKYVEVAFDQPVKREWLEAGGFSRVEPHGDKWRLYTDDPDPAVKYLAALAGREHLKIISVATSSPTLEEAFVQLTGDA